jgi:hypothetical protein
MTKKVYLERGENFIYKKWVVDWHYKCCLQLIIMKCILKVTKGNKSTANSLSTLTYWMEGDKAIFLIGRFWEFTFSQIISEKKKKNY